MKRVLVAVFLSCTGFALTGPQTLHYARLSEIFAGRGDQLLVQVHRSETKTKTIEFELQLSRELNFIQIPKILSRISEYPRWVLPGINDRPGGGKFYVQFNDIQYSAERPQDLEIEYSLDLVVFKHEGKRAMKITTKYNPPVFSARLETRPNPQSVVVHLEAEMDCFPAERESGRVWCFLKGFVEIGPTILYEALPEKLVQKEVGPRIQLVLRNYVKEEDRLNETALRNPVARSTKNRP